MTNRLFTLLAAYEGQPEPQAIYATSETALRMMGRDHHHAAKIKPRLRLIHPDGQTLATLDEWDTDWTEAETSPVSTRESIHFFDTSEEAIAYRDDHGTGGWIFACSDKNSGTIFPPRMTPSDILATGRTSSMGGRFIGPTGKNIAQEDV